jgi:hypothetical protein
MGDGTGCQALHTGPSSILGDDVKKVSYYLCAYP